MVTDIGTTTVVERVFRSLKRGWVSGQIYPSHEEARCQVNAYLASTTTGQRIQAIVDALGC